MLSEFTCPDAVCTSAQTVTLLRVRMVLRRAECGENLMLFIVGIVIALIAAVLPRMRVPGGVNSANLGWMSQQWLAEHRASHSLSVDQAGLVADYPGTRWRS